MLWLRDPKTGKKSATLTFLTWGIVLCSFKLLVSGIAITPTWIFSEFSGPDFATVVGVLAGLYWGRKHTQKDVDEDMSPPVEGGEE